MAGKLKAILFGGSVPTGFAANLGLLIGRASIGLMLAIGHGWGKVYQSANGSTHIGPPDMMIKHLEGMNIPAPTLAAWCAALAEFVGGILLALGLFTRPAAAIIAFNMGVAAFVAHGNDPIFMSDKGAAKEPALLYFFPAVMFMLTGAGHFAADRMFSTLKPAGSSSASPPK